MIISETPQFLSLFHNNETNLSENSRFSFLLVHISIIPNLPYPMNLLHVPFAVVIFLLIVYDQKTGILWALCFGVFLDFFPLKGLE